MKNNYISHAPYLRNSITYDHQFWYTNVKWCYLQQFFPFFKILILGILGGKRAKNDLKSPIWVCYALYLMTCRSYHQDFDDIWCSFFSKMQHFKYYNYFVFLLAHFNSFLIIICFSSSWINAKKSFWGVPHLLHICVIFYQFLCLLNSLWIIHISYVLGIFSNNHIWRYFWFEHW